MLRQLPHANACAQNHASFGNWFCDTAHGRCDLKGQRSLAQTPLGRHIPTGDQHSMPMLKYMHRLLFLPFGHSGSLTSCGCKTSESMRPTRITGDTATATAANSTRRVERFQSTTLTVQREPTLTVASSIFRMSSLSRRACYKCGNVGHYAEVCSSAERLCYNCLSCLHSFRADSRC